MIVVYKNIIIMGHIKNHSENDIFDTRALPIRFPPGVSHIQTDCHLIVPDLSAEFGVNRSTNDGEDS